MSELLTVTVPEIPNPRLAFSSAEFGPIAVLACTEWDVETDTSVRSNFEDYLQDRIKRLKNNSPDRLHTFASAFVMDMNYLYRTKQDIPQGMDGFSLAVAHDGETEDVKLPHAMFLNQAGKTGILAPGKVIDASGPLSAFIPGENGLYATPPEIETWGFGPAATHTIVFNQIPTALYVGQIPALVAMRASGIFEPSSPNHGSITSAL